MNVLVTGSHGFIGRHMSAALAARGDTVHRYDTRVGLDCMDVFDGRHWPSETFDLVVHCAAIVGGRENIERGPAELATYNVGLDAALFRWALAARPGRVVYFSSSAAYPVSFQRGIYAGHALAERDLNNHVEPDNSYGWAKWAGEGLAGWARAAGVPVTVVRPFSGYGADQDATYPFRAMVERARRHETPFDVWGDGTQVRDFVHVDDVVGAVLAFVDLQVDGPVNIGTGVGRSMDDLAEICMRAACYRAPIRHLQAKPTGVQYRVANTRLMGHYYTPTVTLPAAVHDAVQATP
jgi:nucleoside-diphosphate-sugar epimerase